MPALIAGLLALHAIRAIAQPVTVLPSVGIVVDKYYDADRSPTPGVSLRHAQLVPQPPPVTLIAVGLHVHALFCFTLTFALGGVVACLPCRNSSSAMQTSTTYRALV
jgi:hypothetical protein